MQGVSALYFGTSARDFATRSTPVNGLETDQVLPDLILRAGER
jgi:hypothetical protein